MNEVAPSSITPIDICRNPVFVIGACGSGINEVATTLADHTELWTSDDISAIGQIRGFERLTIPPPRRHPKHPLHYSANPNWQKRGDPHDFIPFLGTCLSALFTVSAGGKRWIDKTPENATKIHFLAEMFPTARFLHVLRDGRCAVISAMTDEAEKETDFRRACARWRETVEGVMPFVEQQPERSLTVRFDDLVQCTDATFDQIYRFLQVPSEEAPLHRFKEWMRTRSSLPERPARVIDPAHRWSQTQRQTFVVQAGSAMVRCGFATQAEMRRLGGMPVTDSEI